MIIRPATGDDADAIQAIYSPFCLGTAVTFEEVPPTVEEIAQRIGQISKSHAWLVAEESGVVIGYAYGSPHRPRTGYRYSAEVTVYLSAEYRGRGVGRALYESLFEELAQKGFCRAYAGITQPNEASVRLHLAVGFALIGVFHQVGYKNGTWHDVAWYERSLGTY